MGVGVEVDRSSAARAGSRPGPGRSPSAGRWCRRSRGPRAGGRRGRARRSARRPRRGRGGRPRGRRPRARRRRRSRRLGVEVGEEDGVLDARHRLLQLRDHRGAVEVLAAVAVAVDRDQHLRLDLGEAVDQRAGAEVGRGRGPDRADRGDGEEGDRRLGDVRQVGDDAVALLDPERAQAAGEGGDLGAQLAPGDLAELAQLGGVEDRDLRRRPCRRRRARPSSRGRRGTTRRRASPARRGPGRARRRTPPRSSRRSSPRRPRGRRPTTARAPGRRRRRRRARRAASRCRR